MIAAEARPSPKDLSGAQWRLVALLVASIFVNYIDRNNLSVAAPELRLELGLTPAQLGLLLSAFFWTYAVSLVGAGWLVDRYNVYRAYGAGYLLWSGATALTGFAGSFRTLLLARRVLGMSESVAYPAYSRMIAAGFPEQRRGLVNALIDAGSKIGPAVGTLLGGLVVAGYGWRALFFLLGFGGLVWLGPWAVWAPRGSGPVATRPHQGPGLLAILRKRDAWGTCVGLYAVNSAWYFLLTWLPSYLVMERHFSLRMMAVYGSLPFWGIALTSVAGGWVSDRWITSGATPTRVRKTFMVSGLLAGMLMLPASLIPNNAASMGLLVVACLSFGLSTSNLWAVTQTLAGPEAAGKWTGIQNAFGNIAGVVTPSLTGLIVSETGSFHLAFVAICVILAAGAASYLFLVGKVAPVSWPE
jgi:ACS family D-galactonate transporter-like MFS transporter